MSKKLVLFSIGAVVILLLTCVPISASHVPIFRNRNEVNPESDTVTIKVYHFKKDGSLGQTEKVISKSDHELMMDELTQVGKSGEDIQEIFEQKLQILKDYEIVSSDITLEDILDVEKLQGPYTQQDDDRFAVDNAPLIFAGGGIGFGVGIPFILTSGTFLWILVGFGLALCYDFANKVLHQLLTIFFIPMLVGYLGGFIGLLLLPVIPGFFYSNAFGIGMAAKTNWRLVPSYNISAI